MKTPCMKIMISSALGALLLVVGVAALAQDDARVSADAERAQAAMNDLGSRLKTALVAKMQAEGQVASVGFCHEEAPLIAAAVSAEHGLKVGRTAVRYRSPANAPTPWQEAVLAGFVEEAKEKSAGSLSWVSREGEVYRQARSIATEAACLTCHGSNIAEPVRAAIAATYPDDQATGFAEGDLRGMFWVEIDHGANAGEDAR